MMETPVATAKTATEQPARSVKTPDLTSKELTDVLAQVRDGTIDARAAAELISASHEKASARLRRFVTSVVETLLDR
jgi:uncharacterized membrane protein